MSDLPFAFYVAVGLLLLVGLSLLVMYNRFVRQRTLVEESWGGIDVELSRRHDLIPNLVETVRGYAAHEQAVLDDLVRPGRPPAPTRPTSPTTARVSRTPWVAR